MKQTSGPTKKAPAETVLKNIRRAAFAAYWPEARSRAFGELCVQEAADPMRLEAVMQRMLFTGRDPATGEVVEALIARPKLMERMGAIMRLLEAVRRFIASTTKGSAT